MCVFFMLSSSLCAFFVVFRWQLHPSLCLRQQRLDQSSQDCFACDSFKEAAAAVLVPTKAATPKLQWRMTSSLRSDKSLSMGRSVLASFSQTVGDSCHPIRWVPMSVTLLDTVQEEVELLHEHMGILSARANQSVATPTPQQATGEQVSSLETYGSYHTSSW